MYTKEMGPPPVDIDQASALPPAKKFSKGGVTRADGCAVKGHTKGRMV
jgi:hypothetical protein